MKKLVTLFTVILMFILMLLSSIGCGTTPTGKIAFVGSYEDAPDYSVFIMNADGSNQIELAPAYSMYPPYQCWSPDSTRLAYIYVDRSEGAPGTSWLCLIDADGRNECKLADLTGTVPGMMSWVPDGKTIILGCVAGEAEVIEGKIQERYYLEIFNVDVETGELKKLAGTPDTQWYYPWWSPDGSKIGYVTSNRDPSTNDIISCDIYVMDVDGSNQTRLASHPGEMSGLIGLYWSPDGKKIAYSSYNQEEGRDSSDIYLIDVENTSSINLTNSPTIGDFDPSWSPDGKKIAFCSGITRDVYHLRIMDLNGKIVSELYDLTDYPAGFPSWSPDGKKIVFTDRQNIYAIDADGKNLKTLVKGEGTYRDILYPIWLSQ